MWGANPHPHNICSKSVHEPKLYQRLSCEIGTVTAGNEISGVGTAIVPYIQVISSKVEHPAHNRTVPGSSPRWPTIECYIN